MKTNDTPQTPGATAEACAREIMAHYLAGGFWITPEHLTPVITRHWGLAHAPLLARVAELEKELESVRLIGNDTQMKLRESAKQLAAAKGAVDAIKLPADEWLRQDEYAGLLVMDPDGWDRQNFEVSWNERITKGEFDRRWSRSTCQIPRRMVDATCAAAGLNTEESK